LLLLHQPLLLRLLLAHLLLLALLHLLLHLLLSPRLFLLLTLKRLLLLELLLSEPGAVLRDRRVNGHGDEGPDRQQRQNAM
jgi:hypothetical protein